MKFKIISFKEDLPELRVYKSFLDWQYCSYEVEVDFGFVLKTTKGKPSILVYDNNGDMIAKDFFEFMRYFDKQGLKLI